MLTIREEIGLESILLISIVAGASAFFVINSNNQMQLQVESISSPLAINPTEAPEQNTFSQISPDGSREVIMQVTKNTDNTTAYDFSVADENGANEQHILTKILDSSRSMAIPFNTWSPDNKYFFIQENIGSNKNVFVFKATGAPFTDKESTLEVTDLFEQKNTGNNFSEVTGWASETLIIINTTKEDGSKGPSYWFEVPSKVIIRLSTQF